MTEKLRPCPFCGGEARLQLTDDEGNFRDESYLEDPYSGVGYVIMHDTSNSTECCPIATNLDEILGRYIYDSKQEAINAWNKRDCNDLIDGLIVVYQEKIRIEKKFRDKDIHEMKRIISTDSLTSIEGRYSQLAKRIDDREINIHRMEYFMNELKLIKKEIEND